MLSPRQISADVSSDVSLVIGSVLSKVGLQSGHLAEIFRRWLVASLHHRSWKALAMSIDLLGTLEAM